MSYTNDTKPTSTFTNDTKNSSIWFRGIQYLCDELYKILTTEDSKSIIIDQSEDSLPTTTWTNDTI